MAGSGEMSLSLRMGMDLCSYHTTYINVSSSSKHGLELPRDHSSMDMLQVHLFAQEFW